MVCAAVSGIFLSNTLIKKLGRPSLLIFLLSAVVWLSILILPITEILKILHDPELSHHLVNFSNYCDTAK